MFFSPAGGGISQPANHVITGINADNSTRYGIRSDGSGVVVRGNRITNVGDPAAPSPGAEIGIELAGDRHVVQDNIVTDTTGPGILMLSTGTGIIRGNQLMDTFGLSAAPSGGSPSPNAIVVYENQVINSDARTEAVGINTPSPALVRTRLRQIKHLQCLICGGTSMSRIIRLFFNSLLKGFRRPRGAISRPGLANGSM